ncbi:MAG: MFS transporter [Alphaproteobacteria bacterium]|nr:MFS transporter [Alphaproteobacteria bacterium]
MAFFRNSAVNLLNLHYGIHCITLYGGGAFFLIYLLRAGLSIPAVLLSLALILVGRFVVRPFVIILAARFGLRAMVIAGTLLSAVQYLFLAEVHGVGLVLALLIAVAAVGDMVYWTAYHAYFAALGDNEFRGHQIGVREAIAAVVGIVSPLATGWMLVAFGPRMAFGATAIVTALAALPLLGTPTVAVARHVSGGFKAALPGVLLFMADGWLGVGFLFVWQIALFLSLGESFLGYGGALAFAALVGAVASLTLGRHIDAGHGKRAVWYAVIAIAAIIVLRAIATGHPAFAVLANAVGAFGACLYIPTVMSAVYTLAKQSPCTLRFHVATEGGWDAGGSSGLLVAALAAKYGLPLGDSILLALIPLVAIGFLLRRYYESEGRLEPRPASIAIAAPAATPMPANSQPR